jgi:hypothetical protein
LAGVALAAFLCFTGAEPRPAAGADAALQDPAAALAALQRLEKAIRLQLAEWKVPEGATLVHLVMIDGRVVRIEWQRMETLLGIADQAQKDPGLLTTMRLAMPDETAVLDALGVDLTKPRGAPSVDEIHKRLVKLAQQQAAQVKQAIAARELLYAALSEKIAALAAQMDASPVAADPATAAAAERLVAACKALGDKEELCRCQADAAAGALDAKALGAVAGFFEGMATGRDDLQQVLKEGGVTEQELMGHFATVGAAAEHCKS